MRTVPPLLQPRRLGSRRRRPEGTRLLHRVAVLSSRRPRPRRHPLHPHRQAHGGLSIAIQRCPNLAEQLLHGEPHAGNLLKTKNGLLFIDLETCCRGPVEFDIAHVPEEVSEHYPGADQELLRECRILMLAMVASWRWDRDDRFPNGRRMGIEMLSQLRAALDRYKLDAPP